MTGRTKPPPSTRPRSPVSPRSPTEWWDPSGPLAPLHRLNPMRLAYVKDADLPEFRSRPEGPACARRPDDPRRRLRWRAGHRAALPHGRRRSPGSTRPRRTWRSPPIMPARPASPIDYRAVTAEAQASGPERFDVVTILEVVEHVNDVPPSSPRAPRREARRHDDRRHDQPHHEGVAFLPSSAPNTCSAGCRAGPTATTSS